MDTNGPPAPVERGALPVTKRTNAPPTPTPAPTTASQNLKAILATQAGATILHDPLDQAERT